MAEPQRGQGEPWYSTKVITPTTTEVPGRGRCLPRVDKGEDLSSINAMQQQIRTQASQGNTTPPNK